MKKTPKQLVVKKEKVREPDKTGKTPEIAKEKKNKSAEALLPFISYDRERRGFVYEDGSYMDLLMIRSKDRANLSEDDIEYDSLKLWRLLHVYSDDLKIITMHFPLKMSAQQAYFTRREEQTHNPIHKAWMATAKEELVWLERNLMRKEYYLMCFGKDEKALIENRQRIIINLGRGRDGLIEELSEEKKYQIVARLTNMNAAFLSF